MKTQILFGALGALLIAGCTSASGPTYNMDTITLAGGKKIYTVQCQGLLTNGNTCIKQARKACEGKPVNVLQATNPGLFSNGDLSDARELRFTCGEAEPARAPAAAPAAVAPAPVVVPVAASVPVHKITLRGDANFATGSAALTSQAKSTLDKFIADSRNVTLSEVSISGHTDSTGKATGNMTLSRARAESVAAYLRSHGLRAEGYDIHGFGSSQPVASNKTLDGRAMNRRVEIEVTGQ